MDLVVLSRERSPIEIQHGATPAGGEGWEVFRCGGAGELADLGGSEGAVVDADFVDATGETIGGTGLGLLSYPQRRGGISDFGGNARGTFDIELAVSVRCASRCQERKRRRDAPSDQAGWWLRS